MKTFTVRGGHTVMVDDEDYEKLCELKSSWSCNPHRQPSGHILRYVQSSLYGSLHRYILGVTSDVLVDHIDGNGLNNTKQNLRIVSVQQNSRNKAKAFSRNGFAPTSQYKGVSLSPHSSHGKKKWIATIKPDKHTQVEYLGTFQTEALAAYAYDLAAATYFGEYARLNTPDISMIVAELKETDFFFVQRKFSKNFPEMVNT